MADTLLRSLRDAMIDESESLAGLLRKCLLLGAETKSDQLRDWARRELNGYADEEEVPEYRRIFSPPIVMDSQSGPTWATGQVITRLNLPTAAQKYVGEYLDIRQPIEEVESLAQQGSLSFTTNGLSVAMSVWNKELPMFQNIIGLKFSMSGSVLSGILGQIRTRLVEIIADLTADTPLAELPRRARVDEVVAERLGLARDVYNTTINQSGGAAAIGAGASAASSHGLEIDEVLRLLEAARQAGAHLAADAVAELDEAVEDLKSTLKDGSPNTGDVVKKAGKLQALAERLGVTAVSAATSSATTLLTTLALQGVFG